MAIPTRADTLCMFNCFMSATHAMIFRTLPQTSWGPYQQSQPCSEARWKAGPPTWLSDALNTRLCVHRQKPCYFIMSTYKKEDTWRGFKDTKRPEAIHKMLIAVSYHSSTGWKAKGSLGPIWHHLKFLCNESLMVVFFLLSFLSSRANYTLLDWQITKIEARTHVAAWWSRTIVSPS